jgi:hypothetical protein
MEIQSEAGRLSGGVVEGVPPAEGGAADSCAVVGEAEFGAELGVGAEAVVDWPNAGAATAHPSVIAAVSIGLNTRIASSAESLTTIDESFASKDSAICRRRP